MRSQIPDRITIRLTGLSDTARAALLDTQDRSAWVRAAIERYAAGDRHSEILEGIQSLRQEIQALRMAPMTHKEPLGAPQPPEDTNALVARQTAAILAAFNSEI